MQKKGPVAFEHHYEQIYSQRWERLQGAIREFPKNGAHFSDGLTQPYQLDIASLVAARAVGPVGSGSGVDLCAAPGGKTLVLASTLTPGGFLTANDRSRARRARLHRVLQEHLPLELLEQVEITGHDARRWGLYRPDRYEVVLADVPCSSEAHLLRGHGRIEDWSPTRTRRLAQEAYTILRAAIQSLKPGGRIVYSTCALSPAENEDVVQKAIKRGEHGYQLFVTDPAGEAIQTARREQLTLEELSVGYRILPDASRGAGPIYFCVLGKNPA